MVAKTRRTVTGSRVDARLRAESPAYTESDQWEALAPQSMSVVVSVRLDPASARRLAEMATQEGQTPSALVRDWTMQRLEMHGSTARAVNEAPAKYDVQPDAFETLREQYRPDAIGLLLLGESRPAGGTFFYKADSHLFFATREAWVRAHGSAPIGSEFLNELKEHGVWLYDLAAAPVNRMSGRPRREAVASRTADLVDLLRATNPSQVVAIKRSLGPIARSAMIAAGLGSDRLVVLPFPLYQWRAEYAAGLASVFATLGGFVATAGAPESRAKDGAVVSQGDNPAETETPTQPVTPNDLSSGQIRIPQSSKPVLPDQKGPITAVVRGERLETTYDPRNGPDRSRSGVLRIPRAILRALVKPYERLYLKVDGTVVTLD
jgi:hypothetical protein